MSGEVITRVVADGDTTYLQEAQECADLMARCAEERALDTLRGHRKTDAYHCVMELPVVLVESLRALGMDILTDRDALRRVVNDPAFAAFRTSGGRV